MRGSTIRRLPESIESRLPYDPANNSWFLTNEPRLVDDLKFGLVFGCLVYITWLLALVGVLRCSDLFEAMFFLESYK